MDISFLSDPRPCLISRQSSSPVSGHPEQPRQKISARISPVDLPVVPESLIDDDLRVSRFLPGTPFQMSRLSATSLLLFEAPQSF